MKHKDLQFVIIDEDVVSLKLIELTILKTAADVKIVKFQDPKEGLNFITSSSEDSHLVVLVSRFLPVMDAGEFMEEFDLLSETVKNRCSIFVMSAQYLGSDYENLHKKKNVRELLVKPLTKSTIQDILDCVGSRKVVDLA